MECKNVIYFIYSIAGAHLIRALVSDWDILVNSFPAVSSSHTILCKSHKHIDDEWENTQFLCPIFSATEHQKIVKNVRLCATSMFRNI